MDKIDHHELQGFKIVMSQNMRKIKLYWPGLANDRTNINSLLLKLQIFEATSRLSSCYIIGNPQRFKNQKICEQTNHIPILFIVSF